MLPILIWWNTPTTTPPPLPNCPALIWTHVSAAPPPFSDSNNTIPHMAFRGHFGQTWFYTKYSATVCCTFFNEFFYDPWMILVFSSVSINLSIKWYALSMFRQFLDNCNSAICRNVKGFKVSKELTYILRICFGIFQSL